MGKFIQDISSEPPGSGNAILLRTKDVAQPLDHAQFDQNIWLLAQEALANFNARQGAFVTEDKIKDGAVTADKLGEGAVESKHISPSLANGVVPSGAIFPFAGAVQGHPTIFQDNFLLCDGSLVDRAQFAALYTAIGDIYGSGDGTNTFQLPDLRGRVVLGYQQAGNAPLSPTVVGDPSAQNLGGKGGSDLHKLSIDELPPHQHEFWAANDFNSRDDGRDNASGFNRGSRRRFTGNINSVNTGMFDPADVNAAISKDWRNPQPVARQGGQPHANLQPYMVVNYIIKI